MGDGLSLGLGGRPESGLGEHGVRTICPSLPRDVGIPALRPTQSAPEGPEARLEMQQWAGFLGKSVRTTEHVPGERDIGINVSQNE